MALVTPARTAALALLGECRRRDAHARELLRASKRMSALDSRERAFAQRMVLGVTACIGALDTMINAHLRKGIKLEPRVRDALRISTYELAWLATPVHSAIDQGVALVRSVQSRAGGLANAVLHRVAEIDVPQRLEALSRTSFAAQHDDFGEVTIADLALVSGYPVWLLERTACECDLEVATMLALAACEPPPVYVSINLAHAHTAHTTRELDTLGAIAESSCPNAYRLKMPSVLMASNLINNNDIVVADLSAQRVVAACEPSAGMRVLEVGQGRGTKSLLLENAALMRGGYVSIVGIDTFPFKVEVASQRMESAGLSEYVSCHVFDGLKLAEATLPEFLVGPFDLVLLDAPCSGVGTIRRHGEIAWQLSEANIDGPFGLRQLQAQLLTAAASRVAVGGLLAYTTCSFLASENEQIVDAFLATHVGQSFALEHALKTHVVTNGPDAHTLNCLRRLA